MNLELELYVKNGQKMIWISTEGASGAAYPYEIADDIGGAVADYLEGWYPDIIDNPEGTSL